MAALLPRGGSAGARGGARRDADARGCRPSPRGSPRELRDRLESRRRRRAGRRPARRRSRVVHATRGADTSARAACGAPGPAQLSANRFETTTGRRVLLQTFELFARTKRKFRTRLTNYTLNSTIRLYVSWVILSLTERLLLFSFVGHVLSIFIVERGAPGENADRPRPRPCRRSTSATTGSA